MADDRARLEELRARARYEELRAKAGGAPQPAPQAGRQYAIAPTPTSNKRTGFATQVRQAIKDPGQPVPVPTRQEFNQGFKDFGTGIVQGIPSGAVGLPGDVESLGRLALSPFGVSRENVLPNTTQAGNMIFGEPRSNLQAFGRPMGALAGPAAASKVIKPVAKATGAVAQTVLGGATGAGRPAIQEAVRSGRQGGSAAETFAGHMRGNIASDDAVRMAKDAIEEMRVERAGAYRAGISSTIKGDPAVLDFQPIEDAINRAASVKTFKGQSLSTQAEKARQRIAEVVAEWKALDPAEYHTPEGLDALKQKLGDLIHEGELASVKPHTPASIIVNNAYNAVKEQIVKQAPKYAEVMRDYSRATEQIREVEKTLSLGNKATADTGLRKLQSILRNNANTNYGARAQAGQQLAQRSPDLMPALAGQALNSAVPRGIQGALAGSGAAVGIPAALTGALNPGILGGLLASSPRLVGEAAFAMGNARRVGAGLTDALKKTAIPGTHTNIGGILPPSGITSLTPQMLNQLLLSTRQPSVQR